MSVVDEIEKSKRSLLFLLQPEIAEVGILSLIVLFAVGPSSLSVGIEEWSKVLAAESDSFVGDDVLDSLDPTPINLSEC